MPWRPLPRIAFAVATYPFQASSPADLPLELGDELYIIEEGGIDGSWYRGYLVAPPSLLAGLTSVKGQTLEARVFSGIFPRCCVQVWEVLGEESVEENGEENAHFTGYNDDASNFRNANGEYRHQTPPTLQTGRRHSDGRSNSLRTRRSFVNGDSPQDSAIGHGPSRSSSHRQSNKIDQGLRRKISSRSGRSHQSLRSNLSLTPLSNGLREPGGKRPSAPVPMLKIGDETPTSISEPLVDEVASCLREWHSKNLHELLLARRYSDLEKISDLVYQLDLSRRQLLHGVLTPWELNSRREKTVWDLIDGNKMLSKEIIVRDPEQRGRLLTGNDSVIEMTKLQSIMSLLDKPPASQNESAKLYHFMVDVKAFANSGLSSPSLTISLYSRAEGGVPKQLTESFALDIPSQDHFDKIASFGKFRTLFTDLSSIDVGETSGSESDLYLVVKVHVNQSIETASIRTPRKASIPERSFTPSKSATSASESPTMKGGRRSIMWAQKQLGSTRRRGQQESRFSPSPGTAHSTLSEAEERPDTQESSHSQAQQALQYAKRSIGVGVLNIRHLLGQRKATEHTMSVWSPTGANVDAQDTRPEFDELIRDLINSRNGHLMKSKTLDHVCLNLQCFESPDASSLIRKTPTLLQKISRTPKIGFSGTPTDARSDIYITLSEAFLPSQALLSHPERGTVQISSGLDLQNVQLTLEVRKKTGERIEQCIFPSSNSQGLTAWRTNAVLRGESWDQVIKLVIPKDDVPEAHLIMSIADAPNFPFALSWIPLWDEEAFIRDGPHTPLLYLYDKLTSSSEKGRGAYLAFPWNSRGNLDISKEEVLTGPVAFLKLETFLCSTVFSQDKILLGILKWREQSKGQIIDLLKRFAFVSEIEIVKLVNDVLDALFGILVDHAGKDDLEDLIFDALVMVLGIVHDRRFNLGPLVDKYAEMRFDYPFATPCLMRSYLRLLAKPADARNSRRLRATFKVGRHMLKFIISAREKQKIKEAEIGITATQPTFNREVKNIFKALEALMKDPSPILVGSKTLIVQHIHTWLPELQGSFAEEEIFQLASSFLDSCMGVRSKLILYKLVLILNFTKMTLFAKSKLRHSIVPNTARWIDADWGINSANSDQWRDQIRLCCSIASAQVEEFGADASIYFVKIIESYGSIRTAPPTTKDNLSLLFPTNYPFHRKQIASTTNFDEALIELAAVLAQLIHVPFVQHCNQDLPEFTDTLFKTLDVVISILSEGAFPSSWLSLHIYHHKSSLQILESLFEVMVTDFVPSPDDADDFNTELWRKFLLALLTLVRSPSLALETFAEQKRRAVWKIAGDVREEGADLLRRSWEAIGWDSGPDDQIRFGCTRLGGYQVQYVPSLVAPIVELCFSVHEGLRGVAVKILQTMFVSEWTLSEDLSVIQAEMISCLDLMFKSKNVGEGMIQRLFVTELLAMFESLSRTPGDPFWEAIKELVSTVDELLDLLGAAHCLEITESFRIMHTLQLMDFLKDMQKEDIFIRYVHQLAGLQARLKNPTEAGLALRLHGDLYNWDSKIVTPLKDPDFPEQTSFDRKEQLYFEMIKYFEEGTAWDCALISYRELADQYEHHNYDFAKLARTQHSMAKIYEAIAKGEQKTPRYFRVLYRGLGFPLNLRDKQFIFQAARDERQSIFTDRMRQQHPAAQVASSGDFEGEEGQYLQIFAVSPHRDLGHPIFQQSKVPQSVREYLLSSQIDHFSVTSRRHSPTSEVKDQWVEKTIYNTAESFPNILRRSEITTIDTLRLSPLQTAVERTSRKTSEIALLDKRVRDGDETGFLALEEAVKQSVDPSSVSSVAQYRDLLPERVEPVDEDQEEPPLDPLENALKLALIDHASALKHSLTLYSRHGIDRTPISQALFSAFAPEFTILNPHVDPPTPTPTSPPLSPSQPSLPPQLHGTPVSSPTPQAPAANAAHTRGSRLSLAFLKAPPKPPLLLPRTTNGATTPKFSSSAETDSEAPGSEYGSAAARKDEDERPMTAVSGKSGKVRKRLSLLGIHKAERTRVKGGRGEMGNLLEE